MGITGNIAINPASYELKPTLINIFMSIKFNKYSTPYTTIKIKIRELSCESKTKRPKVLKLKITPNMVDDKSASQFGKPI